MSEKEKEVENEEKIEIDHWSHRHPLTLVESLFAYCYGCGVPFDGSGVPFGEEEKAYGCSQKCGYEMLFHEECAALPRKIRHAMHPQHTLTQVIDDRYDVETKLCAICESFILEWIYYTCTRADCMFWMHMKCAQGSDVMYDAADDEQSGTIYHRSHPKHGLKLLRRSCPFKCDACGTTRRGGKSYMCCTPNCQYWIHQRCASLPQTIQREDHHHSLSLSFHLPPLYIKFKYKCDVCTKYLMSKYWIYHCELCSYVVHLKCAFNKSPHATREKKDDEKGIMEFPISDVGEELIGGLVKRQGGAISIPHIPHHDVDYKFHNHKLRLVSSSSSSQEEEEENSDEDDYGKKSEIICDGCITPIFGRKQRPSSSPSSSSSSSSSKYYMSCSNGCNYNLHLACFHLPLGLPSIPLHHGDDHNLILKSSNKLQPNYCRMCCLHSNGLFYACTKCSFKADIKCASLPDTIYHTAHPQHPLNLLPGHNFEIQGYQYYCGADCGNPSSFYDCYACGSCDFILHVRCAGLPASITSPTWDKHHPLPLTYDANLNHPDEFYCDECETEMNPKSWMYHCRHCDLSFHPECFITASGFYRNIKFGKEYVNAAAHQHPLAYQLLTTKRRCNICHLDMHERRGFHCASCNFFICYKYCGKKMLKDGDMKAVD